MLRQEGVVELNHMEKEGVTRATAVTVHAVNFEIFVASAHSGTPHQTGAIVFFNTIARPR